MARGVLAAHLAGGMTGSLCGCLRAARRSRGSAEALVNPRTNRFRSYYARSHGVLTVRPVGGRRGCCTRARQRGHATATAPQDMSGERSVRWDEVSLPVQQTGRL
jgi:hypothetical protein